MGIKQCCDAVCLPVSLSVLLSVMFTSCQYVHVVVSNAFDKEQYSMPEAISGLPCYFTVQYLAAC